MRKLTVALAGNPNAGKSTLFNALTGARQQAGNWPGVTVERRTGLLEAEGVRVEVVDLPGIYALSEEGETTSIDEKVACDYLRSVEPDLVVNVLDATHLERSLYLTLQLIEQGVPVILVINMMDLAARRGLEILPERLADSLGCPVIPIMARRRAGVDLLKKALCSPKTPSPPREKLAWLDTLSREEASHPDCDPDILRADARYRFIHALCQCAVRKVSKDRMLTPIIDRIVLNRFLGIPVFLLVMYAMFFFSLNVGGIFQDFFDIASDTIFVGGVAHVLSSLGLPPWFIALMANGAGKGIHTTLTFVPVLFAMFFFLALLEDSGYMARAAFIVDRLMRYLGLPGKSLVPIIVGFGCNVPAIMATRTLENERDRILTVMMSPFIPCGARLAIFTVFVSAFFPQGGATIVFCLYLTGVAVAMLTGFFLRKTVLGGEPSPLVMELPVWLLPDPWTLFTHTWRRLRGFVIRAGRLIVPVCVLIGVLNGLTVQGGLSMGDADGTSLLSALGRFVTPIFQPMGLDADNWPAAVGLLTGVLAKEVVIGTLNTLYSQAGHLVTAAVPYDFSAGWHAALASIPARLSDIFHAASNPILASAPLQSLSQPVYGVMYQRFHGPAGAFAYLLFVLLYFPCVSTLAVMWREVGPRWTLFSVVWSIGVAYVTAVSFWQLTLFSLHPLMSLGWGVGLLAACLVGLPLVRRLVRGGVA